MVVAVGSGVDVRRTRTVLVDDHPLYRLGLRMLLQAEPDIEVVGEAATVGEALAIAAHLVPDLAVIDLHLPEQDGVVLTRTLRQRNPECTVLALSGDSEPLLIAQVMHAGASGYVSKAQTFDDLIAAIRIVRDGARYMSPSAAWDEDAVPSGDELSLLSPREREVLELLVLGHSNDEIGASLFIARRTVETHRQRVMNKLGAHTVADLVNIASRLGVGRR